MIDSNLVDKVNIPELVKALRICNRIDRVGNCNECFYGGPDAPAPKQLVNGCKRSMCEDAAAAIEELLSFAHYVADKVTRSDEDWEDYHEAFAEVACRKLVKLGIVSVEDDKYVYSVEVQE